MKLKTIIKIFLVVFLASCKDTDKVINVYDEGNNNFSQEEKIIRNQFVSPKVPEKIEFAGETITFDDVNLKERMDYELVVNNFWHTNTIMAIKRANRWKPVIMPILAEEGVPEDLFYIAVIESNLTNATSPAGAKGFWQFMKATAEEYGMVVNNEIDQRYDLVKSTHAACKYLKKAYDKFGTWTLAAAAYNRGMNGISRDIDEQMVNDFFDLSLNSETSRYVFRLFAVKTIFENPENFGFYIDEEDLYPPYQTKDVVITKSIENIYEWSVNNGVSIKIVRLLNPWIIGKKLTLSNNQKMSIKLPANNEQLRVLGG